ncbi:MAG: hypothetical protein HYZ54_07505 [Ignavibacteriae bacterium]|nr:hypothetical protein [Ignavibacteriota bacterium]
MLKHLPLILFIVILTSCSNSVDNETITINQPKLGSNFTYDEYNTDTTKSERILGSSDTTVGVFVLTGQTYKGKTNVSTVISSTKKGSKLLFDTLYINYETNNDISLIDPSGFSSAKWATIPLASKSQISVALSDTTYKDYFTGELIHGTISLVSSYIGKETMTVKGKSYSVVKIKQLLTFTEESSSETDTDIVTNYLYFSPTFGYMLKMETPVRAYQNGEKEEGTVSNVIDYLLR